MQEGNIKTNNLVCSFRHGLDSSLLQYVCCTSTRAHGKIGDKRLWWLHFALFDVIRFFAGRGWEDTAVIVVDRKVEPKRGGANVSKQVCAPDFWWRVQPKSWTSETTKQASELDIWRCHFGILFYFGNFEPLCNYSARINHIPQYTMTMIIRYTLLPTYPTKDDRRFHGGLEEPIDWGGLGGMDFGRLNFGMM